MMVLDVRDSADSNKIRFCQVIILENILHLLLCERKCITDLKLDILPGIVDLKRKQYALLDKLFISKIDEVANTVQRIKITDIDVPESAHITTGKITIKQGVKLALDMNAANARLYQSVLSFAAKCRKLLWKNVNSGATYTKKGTYQSLSGSLRVNLKA